MSTPYKSSTLPNNLRDEMLLIVNELDRSERQKKISFMMALRNHDVATGSPEKYPSATVYQLDGSKRIIIKNPNLLSVDGMIHGSRTIIYK